MNSGYIIQIIGVAATAAAGLFLVAGLTVRFAFSPFLKARRDAAAAAAAPPRDVVRLDARMDALEDEVRQIGQTLERVATAVEFDAQLRAGSPQAPQLPGA